MAFAAPVLVALSAISTVYSFFSNIQAGEEAAASHKANAQAFANQAAVLEQRAGLERQIAAEKARRQAFINRRIISQQKADFGTSGVDPSEGSPLEVISESAAQGKLSELDQLYAGELNASGFLTEAAKAKTQAGFESYNAKLARSAASRRAFSSLLGGAAGTGLGAYQMGLLKTSPSPRPSGTDVGGFGLMTS